MTQLKDRIIQGLAEKMKLPMDTVEAVVLDQFKNIAKAMSSESSIEMTGFGVFHLNHVKSAKMLKAMKQAAKGERRLNIKKQHNNLDELLKEIDCLENQLKKCPKYNK